MHNLGWCRVFGMAAWMMVSVVAPTLMSGCAHVLVEGTEIKDTEENRAILNAVQAVAQAIETRDQEALLAWVSPNYFEDLGNADPKDDYGYFELKEHVAADVMQAAQEVHLNLQVHDIVVEGNKAHADVRYHSRARLKFPTGSLWDSHNDFNRLEFVKENGAWRIVSGL